MLAPRHYSNESPRLDISHVHSPPGQSAFASTPSASSSIIMTLLFYIFSLCLGILAFTESVFAIKCYQCSTEKDGKGVDNCGAYTSFDAKNIAVDCMGEEAVTPGTFCFKSIQQGPRGFIWDGRWRSVIRRCAQVSERGISWGCDWGYHENGVYWEECYCAEDHCNSAQSLTINRTLLLALAISIFAYLAFLH